MCFVLYAGTERQLPRKPWDKAAPDLCVESLSERDSGIKSHFTKPEVQYVGSTSGCGCDFPNVTLQNGEWPIFEDDDEDDDDDGYYREWAAKVRRNREDLVALLRSSGERSVELYGVWDEEFDEEPKFRETIRLEKILDPNFYFKERGFYAVKL